VNTVINLRVPKKAGNFLTNWVTVSFTRRILLHWGSQHSYGPKERTALNFWLLDLIHRFALFEWHLRFEISTLF
jgi:hypothetical protein